MSEAKGPALFHGFFGFFIFVPKAVHGLVSATAIPPIQLEIVTGGGWITKGGVADSNKKHQIIIDRRIG